MVFGKTKVEINTGFLKSQINFMTITFNNNGWCKSHPKKKERA